MQIFIKIDLLNLLLKDLKDLDGNLETDAQLAVSNPALLNSYVENVRESEIQALRLQSRIKLLFIQSPLLRGDPDNVDRIMAQIDNSLGAIDKRKLALGLT